MAALRCQLGQKGRIVMQAKPTRLTALLLGLGIADLAYVDFALGPQLFGSASASEPRAASASEPRSMAAARAGARVDADEAVEAAEVVEVDQLVEVDRDVETVEAVEADPVVAGNTAGVNDSAGDGAPPAERSPLGEERDWMVHFPETNTAELPDDTGELLVRIGRHLQDHPALRVTVTGHADARGTRSHNLKLGARRARAVSRALIRAGVAARQLRVESRGEDEPRAVGAGENAWAQNRRVEIAIHTARSRTP
jgi:peptidoglycan-associated lipoprotein